MGRNDLAARAMRYGVRCIALAFLGLFLSPNAPHGATQCDYSGFDRPCNVAEGSYRVLIPEGEGPFPVMVYLYGSGGHSVSVTNHPLFDAAVVQRGYALIVPAALSMEYRPGLYDTGWNLRHEPTGRRDEVSFIEDVIADVGRRFPIDRDRVVLVGQSRGAFLIWEIACHDPQTATAYAVHAGGYLGKLPNECASPVRFLHSHGLADPIVPFAGAPLVSGGVAMTPHEQSLEVLARTNGCDGPDLENTETALELHRTHWAGCAPGSSLDLMLHEGGHVMPLDWFRAVLDWFEEPPAEAEEILPRTVAAGARISDRFKAVPTGRPALPTAQQEEVDEPRPGRRLQPPASPGFGASRNASQ